MSTKFIRCPNRDCNYRPNGGLFGTAWVRVYECKDCDFHYCYRCGSGRCPRCASKERREVGKVWAK